MRLLVIQGLSGTNVKLTTGALTNPELTFATTYEKPFSEEYEK
jgi:hypothetical protein